jgi:hypothetical protein
MSNRIVRVTVQDRSVVPAAAESWVTVVPERLTPTTEVRGRLTGPRCPYAETVEVAYPLRPLPPARGEEPAPTAGGITRRVVIPEASPWEPESPFLYEGTVELWQDGQRCDRVTVRHGLRTLTLGPRGLRINGRPLRLRGREVIPGSDEQALALRRDGWNLLVAPVGAEAAPCWERADRLGFLVLGRVTGWDEHVERQLSALRGHASCLGWLLRWPGDPRAANWFAANAGDERVGIELDSPPGEALPPGIQFIVCPAGKQVEFSGCGLPLLLSSGGASDSDAEGVIGTLA